MTALVVLDNISAEDLEENVVVTNAMNFRFNESGNPNTWGMRAADFEVGQKNLTYKDCLYALMLHAACDAANILAGNVADDIMSFVDMMNEKAKEIGADRTNFTTPYGLHEKNSYTCAYDMFLITKYAYERFPMFTDLLKARNYLLPENDKYPGGVTVPNNNRMILQGSPYFYDFAVGGKTSFVGEMSVSNGEYRLFDADANTYSPAVSNFVSIAAQRGYTYLIVTMGAPYSYAAAHDSLLHFSYTDHRELYRWAFGSMEYQTVLSVNEVLGDVTVIGGTSDRVQLRPVRDFSTLLPGDIDRTAVLREVVILDDYKDGIDAPVERGEILGYVELKLAGTVLDRVDLIAAADIQISTFTQIPERISEIFDQPWFKACIAAIVALTIFVVVLRIMQNTRGKKQSMKRSRNKKIRR
jgi:D-alanyl-D-alanine carboxypeptidase (penicillin-binding protein 5/6)